MTRILDLLGRDFSLPVQETLQFAQRDPDSDFIELTEFVATDHIKASYERLLGAMVAAAKAPQQHAGVWISGFFGCGKSTFANTLALALADREVRGTSTAALFLKHVDSPRVAEFLEFLNRTVPCEVFRCDMQSSMDPPAQVMFRALLRGLECPDESGGRMVDKCVERCFELCQAHRPGKTFAFVLDEMSGCLAHRGERLEQLCTLVEQFGKGSARRTQAGLIPGPVWIIVTAQDKPDLPAFRNCFPHQIELSTGDIREAAMRRVLRKKPSGEPFLRQLFRDRGASLMDNLKLERSSRRTDFDEDEFVKAYPYPPHLIDLSLEILAGIRQQPNSPQFMRSVNRTIVKQFSEMLIAGRPGIGYRVPGVLVSLDEIYDLAGGNIAWEKQIDIFEIGQRLDGANDLPGLASRVAKAICLMQFVKAGLPRTARNIAALLIQRVTETPLAVPVQMILDRLQAAQLARETEDGWELYDFDELRESAAALGRLGNAVGSVNPRQPGWHNRVIQVLKTWVARGLTWYMRPQREFNAGIHRSLEQMAGALDRLSMSIIALETLSKKVVSLERREVALEYAPDLEEHLALNLDTFDHISMDILALSGRLSQPEKRTTRTAYLIGLMGTGRVYLNGLIREHIGARERYFRDTIRLHPGPTPMIYTGHATIKYLSCLQAAPKVTKGILESVQAGFADLIFVYRHPLDSLLTNWVCWRTYLRENRWISGISMAYRNMDDLYADLDRDFSDFEAFVRADPNFFAGEPGPRFLSFAEFVEETELYLQYATLSLRLEDFSVDPGKEFAKIAELMSVDFDPRKSRIVVPTTKPYRYLTVKQKVPRFQEFIDNLDEETKRRIDTFGYPAL